MSAPVPITRANGEGERLWFAGGGVQTWKATSEDTGGAFILFEDVMSRGKLTPLHRHPEVDETVYVLEGEILVHHDGEEHRIGPGGVSMVPRGVPHALTVLSESARMLCMQTPGSAEAFYRDASEPAPEGADDSGPVDFDRVRASAAATGGTEILGPAPFTRAGAS
jgi:quercetin dioxygenase-like cupin family protein